MSFFQRLGSGSDDSSDSGSDSEESILSGDEGEEQDQKLAAGAKKKSGASQFMRGSDEDSDDDDEEDDEEEEAEDEDGDEDEGRAGDFLRSSDEESSASEEDEKTTVLSAKDKRFAEMDAAIHSIQNATKAADGAANDWVLASSELDKLLRFIARHQTAMTASPIPPAGHIPPSYLQTLVELESSVNDTYASEKNANKKMSAVKAKALQGMRQTLKKKMKEFEGVLAIYNADPALYGANYEAANRAPKVPKKAEREAQANGDGAGEPSDFQTIGRGGRALNLSAEGVFKTLREIFEARGKKNTDRAETIRILVKLYAVCKTPYAKIRVLLALIPARLDYSQALPSMPFDSWVSCRKELDELLDILLKEPDYVVQETVEEYDDQVERVPEEVDGKIKRVAIAGNIVSVVENLDNEFTKTLQHTDAHEKGSDYIERLREEQTLYSTIIKAQVLFERENWSDAVARAIMRRLDHIYSKPDIIVQHFEDAAAPQFANLQSSVTPFGVQRTPSELVHLLCVYIYSSDAPLLRARAILVHIFNHAMHGRYHQARDLLLMSHLQDTVAQADVTTQILYNRAMMQLGLAAFRNGFIPESQTIFAEMFSTSRQKELMAQSIQRYGNQLSPEQELIEKRRLLPFHMHLNVELLEAAYLTSCMLLEIPMLAAADTEEQKRRSTSKVYKRLLDQADKQAFMGPPESTRDHIIKASKALLTGDWESARDLILTIKVWQLLDEPAAFKEMLTKKIKEEGLRTYLFTNSPFYASLSLAHLSSAFDLSIPAVTSIISRMIYTDELAASLDQIDSVVIFHRVETTEIQKLAQQLADRAVGLVEANEKLLDAKLGNAGNMETRAAEGGAGRGRTERRGGGRGRGTRGRGRGGFNTGLGEQRRVSAA